MANSPVSRPMGGPPGAGTKPSLRAAMSVFESRNYRYLWTSSLFSFTGMQMQQVARALLAWELTHSFSAVGAVSLSFGLPMLIFSLVGGSLADRFEKRNLSLVTQAATATFALINAFMVMTGAITINWLFVLGLGGGTAAALGMPARTPLMAEVVGRDRVMSAIAMSNAAMNGTRLFGPALAGAIVGIWNLQSVYFLQAILYVFSCLTLMRVPSGLSEQMNGGRPKPTGSMFHEIGEGLRYVANEPRLRMLIMTMFVVSFFAMPYTMLLAGFVKQDLGGGDTAFGILQSVSGMGALVGSLGIATITAYERKGMVQWLAGILGGGALVGLAVLSAMFGYIGALGAVIFLGLSLTAYQTLNSTMIMDTAEPVYYGRVMSINMLTFSAMPLMAYPMGRIADAIGVQQTFAIEGFIVMAFMVLEAVRSPGHVFGRAPRRPLETAGPPEVENVPAQEEVALATSAGGT